MKFLMFTRKTFPTGSEMFGDTASITQNGNPVIVYNCARTWPNPYKPQTKKTFDLSYGVIALGNYKAICVIHEKYGKCLLINNGENIPAALPNVNHNNLHIIAEAFVHCSDSDTWPGSAGCLTIMKSKWPDFISYFNKGEEIALIVKGL